jgi:dephospho-CoA kinase
VVVTGASGAGKTTLVRAVEARNLHNVACYYFDSVGVPPVEAMTAEFGSPEEWQAATTNRWIADLAVDNDPNRIAVLDGQVRPSVVVAAFKEHGVSRGNILLIDCSQEIREARVRSERGQPELASPAMTTWAAYLRGQADALGLSILDTTQLTVEQALEELIHLIKAHGPA